MLESMIRNPRPTRAETTDIANAIFDGTTAIMLSGESAAGKYPVEAVKTMAKIAENAEKDIDYGFRMRAIERGQEMDITTAIAYATCTAAMDLKAAAIITVTLSGFTAEAISRFKPKSPVIGCTVREKVSRQLNLLWGVKPLLIQEEENAEHLFDSEVEAAKEAGYVKAGDVCRTSVRLRGGGGQGGRLCEGRRCGGDHGGSAVGKSGDDEYDPCGRGRIVHGQNHMSHGEKLRGEGHNLQKAAGG